MEEKYMQEVIKLAEEKMLAYEGGPFGAVVVREDRIVGRGWNQVTSINDPTAHAEIVAIRDACRQLETFWLGDCEIYVNCEPCPMCLAAVYWSGIPRLYYATTRKDAAAIGFADEYIYSELEKDPAARNIEMIQLMRPEALSVFARWNTLEGKVEY